MFLSRGLNMYDIMRVLADSADQFEKISFSSGIDKELTN